MSKKHQQLNQTILNLETEIKKKQIILKQLKKERGILFITTPVGKFSLSFLKIISKPFIGLNHFAKVRLEDPYWAKLQKDITKANKLLFKVTDQEFNEKLNNKYIKKLADVVHAIENNPCHTGYDECQILIQSLKEEIDRLRPTSDEKQNKLYKDVSKMLDEEIYKCCQQQLHSQSLQSLE